jgi:hypothetical protein
MIIFSGTKAELTLIAAFNRRDITQTPPLCKNTINLRNKSVPKGMDNFGRAGESYV